MSSDFVTVLAIVAIAVSILCLLRLRALSQRVAQLEQRLAPQGKARPWGPEAAPSEDLDAATTTQALDSGRPVSPTVPIPGSIPVVPRKPRPSVLAGLAPWLRDNWIYPVAAAALIMAAVFLVQYSIERGLLSPQTRIALALGLGAGLIAIGEAIRRRWGDDRSAAKMLPSTLSGAGIVALLAAVLAAFHLYAMLSQPMTLLALGLIAALAMALGWVHGPLLAALGVVAGAAAPFLLGESAAPKDLLYAYFALIALLGLGIDGFKRWGWVSALAVVAPMAGGWLIAAAGAGPFGFAGLFVAVPVLAMALPSGALVPRAEGPMIAQARHARPDPATQVSALALGLACLGLVFMREPMVSLLALGGLALIHPLWTRRAPALADQVVFPALGVPAAIFIAAMLAGTQVNTVLIDRAWLPIAIVALTALAGLAMLRRSDDDADPSRVFWALAAIGTPGATLVAFELFWRLSARLDAWTWALTAMAMAAGYAAVALWAAKRDAGQGLRLGASAAAAFAMIALALMLTVSLSALTVALAVLMIAAAALDRRFDIPALGWFQVLGAMALSWRLVIDPGLNWLLGWEGSGGASSWEVWISLAAALIGPAAALALTAGAQRSRIRDWTTIFIETALSGMIPIVLAIGLARFLARDLSLHANLGLQASVLIALAWVQAQRAHRLTDSRGLTILRRVLTFVFGGLAALALILSTTVLSPLAGIGSWFAYRVAGAPVLNDLIIAYAVPGALLLWIVRGASARAGLTARAVGCGLLAYWVALALRHLWHGGDGMALRHGFEQGELYAYTVALLLAGAGAIALALRLGRNGWRVAGLALIGIAAAKGFLVDASGLTGLMRVGAFLALGLSLAGLAVLNAWVSTRMAGVEDRQ